MNFNRVTLGGRLTRDVELKYLPSGMAVAEFGMAMSETWKSKDGEKKEDVCFVDVSAFGKTAEVISEYFSKGKNIFFEGKLKFEQWEDKNGGGKRSKLKVILEKFQFVDKKESGEDKKGGTQGSGGDSNDIPNDEIPF